MSALIRTPAEIEQLAAKAGKSMLQVCREAEIAPSTWARWKAGETSPTLNNYMRIAKAVEPAEA
jgi:transcriptional regulator with XRE-family HTH domain